MGQYRQGHRTEKVGGKALWDNIDKDIGQRKLEG